MDLILLISLFILAFIGLPIGFDCLLYYVPRKLGYPKTGRILTRIFGLVVLTIVLWTVFEDQLFTKGSAKELVEEQQIILVDEFSLTKNQSASAIGDYYHTFILRISNRDKQHAISQIINSSNFRTISDDIDDVLYLRQGGYFGYRLMALSILPATM